MKAIDLCAGAGGLSLGLQRAGFDVLGVERERVAGLWHREHVGPCDLADVTAWHPSERVDLVAGGVPCQAFSTAGRRAGMRETVGALFPGALEARAHLYQHLIRVAVEAHARAVVLENVVGLVQWDSGAAIAAIVEAMQSAGFASVEWRILDAADFGVPQHRKRLFVVGLRQGAIAWPEPTHGPGRATPWVTVRDALGLVGDYEAGRLDGASGWNGQRRADVDAPSSTIGTRRNPDLLSRPAPTITTSAWHAGSSFGSHRESKRPLVALTKALAEAGLADRPSTTLQAGGGGRIARPGHKVDGDQWKGCVRLTASQCATLQGFPPWDWSRLTSTDAHRLIGNAVPPALGEVVGRAVFHNLSRERNAA